MTSATEWAGPPTTGRVGEWSSDEPTTASKRSLVAVSHAIEQALLQGPVTSPTVVVALFQRLAYFEREYALYEQLAASGVVVVLGFTDGEAHQVPRGCRLVVLDPHEPLADEWTVIAVGPAAGAFLVATDAHRFDPTEQNLEAGREFEGRWGYSRVQAGNELARMRVALGPRLDTAAATTIDHLLASVMPVGGARASSAGTDGEAWATASLHLMVERMQDARAGSRVLRAQLVDAHAAAAARAGAHTDPQSGLTTPEFLGRWSNTGGPTALPVGVAVFDVAGLDPDGYRGPAPDRRAAYHAARRVAAAMTEPLGPVDAAVRLSAREFALVVPGASRRHLRELVAAVGEQLEMASDGYPHVPLSATVSSTVTLSRPLPLDDLHLALGAVDQPAPTLTGDPITVTTTAAHPPATGVDDPRDGRPRPQGPGADHARSAGPDTDQFPRIRVDAAPRIDSATPAPDATPAPVRTLRDRPADEGADVAPGVGTAGAAPATTPSPEERRGGSEADPSGARDQRALSMLGGLPRRVRGHHGRIGAGQDGPAAEPGRVDAPEPDRAG